MSRHMRTRESCWRRYPHYRKSRRSDPQSSFLMPEIFWCSSAYSRVEATVRVPLSGYSFVEEIFHGYYFYVHTRGAASRQSFWTDHRCFCQSEADVCEHCGAAQLGGGAAVDDGAGYVCGDLAEHENELVGIYPAQGRRESAVRADVGGAEGPGVGWAGEILVEFFVWDWDCGGAAVHVDLCADLFWGVQPLSRGGGALWPSFRDYRAR